MKHFIYSAIITCFILFSKSFAQTNSNHPSISEAKVSYKSVPQTTVNTTVSNQFHLSVIPQATVSLISTANVAKIYFKIINTISNTVVYQANYLINSPVITNSAGKKLFENNNGVIFISNGQVIDLKAYLFEITTEDNQQVMSPVYSSK